MLVLRIGFTDLFKINTIISKHIPLHVRVESSGRIIPFSNAIREEIILNVEHGELLVSASF